MGGLPQVVSGLEMATCCLDCIRTDVTSVFYLERLAQSVEKGIAACPAVSARGSALLANCPGPTYMYEGGCQLCKEAVNQHEIFVLQGGEEGNAEPH